MRIKDKTIITKLRSLKEQTPGMDASVEETKRWCDEVRSFAAEETPFQLPSDPLPGKKNSVIVESSKLEDFFKPSAWEVLEQKRIFSICRDFIDKQIRDRGKAKEDKEGSDGWTVVGCIDDVEINIDKKIVRLKDKPESKIDCSFENEKTTSKNQWKKKGFKALDVFLRGSRRLSKDVFQDRLGLAKKKWDTVGRYRTGANRLLEELGSEWRISKANTGWIELKKTD